MPERPRKRLFPNPFYVVLLVASTAFVVTALAYLVSPYVAQSAADHPADGPGPGSLALADWFDRQSPTALAIEFAVMLVAGLLAMVTDRPSRDRPTRPDPSKEGRVSDPPSSP